LKNGRKQSLALLMGVHGITDGDAAFLARDEVIAVAHETVYQKQNILRRLYYRMLRAKGQSDEAANWFS